MTSAGPRDPSKPRSPATAQGKRGFLVLGNQLFDPGMLRDYRPAPVYMAEDEGLCTYVRHHKQKLVLFLAAMRAYCDELRAAGFEVSYRQLAPPGEHGPPSSYEAGLGEWVDTEGIEELLCFEIEDKFFEARIERFCRDRGLALHVLPSPMFVTPREQAARWLDEHRPLMANFYRQQRKSLGLLLDARGKPQGGKWSFDADNRKRLPRKVAVPPMPRVEPSRHVAPVVELVRARFDDHPGALVEGGFWLPTTRRQARSWFEQFLHERFAQFGPYEDALSTRGPCLFHGVLTPALNLGLLTPSEVIERALAYAAEHDIPLASLEGLVRQVVGWREFVRAIYRRHSETQSCANFFGHRRRLGDAWWQGTTGLVPLDDVIQKAWRLGYAHHIERLMVVGNLMTLCEIDPSEAHRWFMEMFVDSSDWVMGPNVYGMALFADGGLFTTKPYLCGSNYILKMSDYAKPRAPAGEPTWADTLDGLYWRFIDGHRRFFSEQARLPHAVRNLERMDPARRRRIFAAAESFLERTTEPAP